MNGAQESLKKAVAIVTKAITADQEEKYEEAFALYQRALEYFMHGLKCECKQQQQKTPPALFPPPALCPNPMVYARVPERFVIYAEPAGITLSSLVPYFKTCTEFDARRDVQFEG